MPEAAIEYATKTTALTPDGAYRAERGNAIVWWTPYYTNCLSNAGPSVLAANAFFTARRDGELERTIFAWVGLLLRTDASA